MTRRKQHATYLTRPGHPALDNGSAHFRNRKGDEVPSGMISVELTPGMTPGWRGLEFHS